MWKSQVGHKENLKQQAPVEAPATVDDDWETGEDHSGLTEKQQRWVGQGHDGEHQGSLKDLANKIQRDHDKSKLQEYKTK